MQKYVVRLSQVDKNDIGLVGGKGANLGEMIKAGFPVPNGFVVTSAAYFYFLEQNKLKDTIRKLLSTLDPEQTAQLQQVAQIIQRKIIEAVIPSEVEQEIKKSYGQLAKGDYEPYVAVRSSATAEDLPKASFAGQQATFLNVVGEEKVATAVKDAWASLFEARAIYYRQHANFDHFKVGIAVPVQLMVDSDSSGVIFTVDPVTGNKGKIVIEAIYGLGEMIVQGQVTPDHYELAKVDFLILAKQISVQKRQLVRVDDENKVLSVAQKWQNKQKISDQQMTKLAKIAKKIEEHYFFPQDIEWAIENDKIYIVQTRPITTIKDHVGKRPVLIGKTRIDLPIILRGAPASPGIAFGPVRIIGEPEEISKISRGEILVAEMTNPDFVPAMKKAVAVVTDKGGSTSHAAIVSRAMGIPAVVGTERATKTLKNGLVITVDGGTGKIYKGGYMLSAKQSVALKKKERLETPAVKTATKVYVNLAEPELAASIAAKDCDGVGLLRAEFMIAQFGVHPKELIAQRKERDYVDKLAEGISKICQEFYPRPVFYRSSDFKTNEYRDLKGGVKFEPAEQNPMIGYRGAFRYVAEPHVFRLELEAIKKVRNKNNFKNINLMLPYVRSVEELRKVRQIIATVDLFRGPSFKLWMMVELPVNVILLDQFIKVGIDGISIGSNDLTMLLLGVDRDNAEVAPAFDETSPAVLWALEKVIKTAHNYGISSSICGQAASNYSEIIKKVVEFGITSISVNADVLETTRQLVADCEAKLVRERSKHGKD